LTGTTPAVHRLPNGLTVILQPVPYAPVAACVVAYRIAPLWEGDSDRGLSHFCEHMMFRGTSLTSGSRFWQIVQRDGGVSNAFTSRDMTAYYAVVPNGRLDDILSIEADRMRGCSFNPEAVATEKRVVLEERMMTNLDSPSGALSEELHRTAFTVHPYRHPVTGYRKDIEAFDRDRAYTFYRRYYTPSNCLLVLTGRIDPGSTMGQVEDSFGSVEGPEVAWDPVHEEPPQTEERRVTIEHSSSMNRVQLAFRGARSRDGDNLLLDLATMYLAGGRTGRLEESLVQTGLATDITATNDNCRDPGLFTLEAGLVPGIDPGRVIGIFRDEVERLRREPIPEQLLDSLRRRFTAMQAMTVASPAGLALEYAMGWCISDDPFATFGDLEMVRDVSAEQVADASRKILDRSRSTVALLEPADQGAKKGLWLPSRPGGFVPDVTPPSQMDFEDLHIDSRLLEVPHRSISEGAFEETFPGCLRVLIRRDHSFPLVSIAFSVPMGSGREPPEQAGLTAVTAEAMRYGTADMTYMEFNGLVESIGAELAFGGGSEHAAGHLTMLSEDVTAGLRIVECLVRRPAFRTDDVDRVLKEARAEVEMRGDMPFAVSLDRLARMMTEPERMARIPTVETLSAISADSVREFHDRCVRPEGSVIVVVGDVVPDMVSEELHHLFDRWANPSSGQFPVNPGVDSTTPSTSVTRMEGMAQTAVTLGFPAPARHSSDRIAFHLINAILGDGIGSRLGRSVRDSSGLAYSVGSEYYTGRNRGRFLAYLSTTPSSAWKALDAVRREIDLLLSTPVDTTELKLAKASSMGRHALGLMHYHNVADYLLLAASTGRPLDQDIRNLRSIAGIDSELLREVAVRWLGERDPFVSLAGDIGGERDG
jgi:zinc protease